MSDRINEQNDEYMNKNGMSDTMNIYNNKLANEWMDE